VVGLEGDIQYADFGAEGASTSTVTARDLRATATGSAPCALAPVWPSASALIYATGGFAFADDATGWTVGGGVEYAFTNNLSAKIEGLYVNLEATTTSLGFETSTTSVWCALV
jgi:outer membrane immunogenic protein